jgi:hypothetical protein
VQGKQTFPLSLNVIILQTVRNKCVRFGGHVHIEVRLQDLMVASTIQGPNFAQLTLLSIGADLRLFCSKTPLVFRG